jgi:hypothetical protein
MGSKGKGDGSWGGICCWLHFWLVSNLIPPHRFFVSICSGCQAFTTISLDYLAWICNLLQNSSYIVWGNTDWPGFGFWGLFC